MNCSPVPFFSLFSPFFGVNTKVVYFAFNSPAQHDALHHADCIAQRTALVISPSLQMTKHIRGRKKREGINK